MTVGFAEMTEFLADSDTGALLQVVVVVVVMIASAVSSLLAKKKKEEPPQDLGTPPAPPQRRWPPAGTTTGTTIPSQGQPVRPLSRRTQPVMRSPAKGDSEDSSADRLEQLERQRQERASQMEREMVERSEQLRNEAQGRAVAAAQKIRGTAAKQARHAAEQSAIAAAAARAVPVPGKSDTHRIVTDDKAHRSRQMPEALKALLAEQSWRTAIIMAEIISPPLALRDPDCPGGTTPPAAIL